MWAKNVSLALLLDDPLCMFSVSYNNCDWVFFSLWFQLTWCIRFENCLLLNGNMKYSVLVNRKYYCYYDRLKYNNYNDDIVPKIVLNIKD